MKKPDNIEDWYLDKLSNYEVVPDDNIWNKLSDNLDKVDAFEVNSDNIEQWYKAEISKFESQPTHHVWNKLSSNLDINRVWSRLITSLGKYDTAVRLKAIGLRTAAIFALVLGFTLTYHNFNTVEKVSTSENQSGIPSQFQPTNNRKLGNSVSKQGIISNSSANIKMKKNTISSTQSKSVAFLSNNSTVEKDNSLLYASVSMPLHGKKQIDFYVNNSSEQIINSESRAGVNRIIGSLERKEFMVKKDEKKIIFNDKRFSSYFAFGVYAKRLYFGINGGIKEQQLISFSGKSSNKNLSKNNYLDFGYSVGATLGIIASDMLNIETNLNVISTNGFKHSVNLENEKYNEELNLNYTSLSIIAKKMNNKSTFDNKKYSTNIMGGLYGSILSSAELISKQSVADVKNQYKTMDIGIVLGIEQDRYVTKEFVITPGIRYYQGLINIGSNSPTFMGGHTSSLEFNVGVKYIFLKKS